MQISSTTFQRLKARAEETRSKIDQAKGQLSAALAALQEEFGVDGLEAAKGLAEDLDSKIAKETETFRSLHEQFENKYGKLL